MMMKKRLWRVVTVCLLVFLPCWHPIKYVGCAEQPPEAQSMPAPAQDSSREEDPGDKSHHRGVVQVEEGWGSQYAQYLSEEEVLPEGEEVETQQQGLAGEEAETPGTEVEDKEHVKTLDLEDSVAEKEQETAWPEARLEAEQPPPEAVVTQEQKPTPASDLSPPPSAPALNPIPEDPSSTPSSSSSVPEEIVSDVPLSESSDADLAIADCEAGETNPFDDTFTSLPVVLENTSNALGKGTKTDIDPPLVKDLSSHIITETDPSVATKDPEDIPTFDEWKKKMMEVETEKTQATHTSSNGGSHAVKKVQKNFNNYASVECGAKILGSNPEAKSTSAILMESMDHYMLNPCSNKIWFIIELCDPIQVKQLDIANFELFSSTPKDFLVSISDRYPTNKWVKRGTFHARDERTVQSFPLDEHLYTKYVKMFTKYIKVELVSHHGSEHFCPLSLIRVFGTSMVEEYEEIADPLDRPDDQDDDLGMEQLNKDISTSGSIIYPNLGDILLSKHYISIARQEIK